MLSGPAAGEFLSLRIVVATSLEKNRSIALGSIFIASLCQVICVLFFVCRFVANYCVVVYEQVGLLFEGRQGVVRGSKGFVSLRWG